MTVTAPRTATRLALAGLALSLTTAACTVQAEPATSTNPGGATSAPARRTPTPAASPQPATSSTAEGSPAASGPLPASPGSTTSAPATSTGTAAGSGCTPERTLETLTLEQRAGQLLMVGVPADGAGAARRQIQQLHVGNVMLTGRTSTPLTTIGGATAGLQSAAREPGSATGGVGLWVSTDEEGGQVRVLRSPGLADMPAGLTQSTWPAATLEVRAAQWGGALRKAGVNVNLAPVLDLVPRELGKDNAPIGAFQRQLGWDPETITRSGGAFVRGMRSAGVASTIKHFPGLGAVRDNTDTTPVVVDRSVSASAPALEPFRALIGQGVPLLMVSSARYEQIDPGVPALYSTKVIGLAREMGFRGVIITDDVGGAKAPRVVGGPGEVARRAVAAGVDLVLTVDPEAASPMVGELVSRARRDPDFRRRVDESALRVLQAKAGQGLLPGGC